MLRTIFTSASNETQDQLPRALCARGVAYALDGKHLLRECDLLAVSCIAWLDDFGLFTSDVARLKTHAGQLRVDIRQRPVQEYMTADCGKIT